MRATALYPQCRQVIACFGIICVGCIICGGLASAAGAPQPAARAVAEDLCFIKLQPDAQGAISLSEIESALTNCRPDSGLLIQANQGSTFDERSASLLAAEYCDLDHPVNVATSYVLCRYVKQRRIPTLRH